MTSSNGLRTLGTTVVRETGGWRAQRPETLWDQFLAEYPGPQGMRSHWLGLDAIARQVQTVRDAAAELDVIVSGDPALVAWDVERTGSPDADDAAVQALADVAEITKRIENDRIVGGDMVSLLLSAFPVRGALLRRTADAHLTPFQASDLHSLLIRSSSIVALF